ncbi:MAG: hypothetical protein Q8M26_07300 [Pseudolabrys sp.]|nr:hypothetical protein [Pseudolabrys sp.]
MNIKLRQIEVDAETAEALETQAEARGISLQQLVSELAGTTHQIPADLEALRAAGRGPWAPEILAEDARRLAEYNRVGEGVPWDDVRAWMQSWGTAEELPPPRPRKL